MSNFSIEPYFDPIKQWRYYITNDVAMRMPYDINDPLFLQKVSVLQAEQVKHMVAGSYSQTAAFRDETSANFTANRQAMEKGMNMLGSRITQVGGMITNSLENGFAAMNYGFTDLSNKADIANAYLSSLNKGIALSNQYSQQLVQLTEQLNAGVAQVNRNLVGINNNLIAINRTLSAGFSVLNIQLSAISSKLDSILEELRIPETQRERRYHIQEGMKYLAQATKDNDDLYFEDALDEFNKAISIESKDFFSHYYVGYIYMYSKEHLDIDKAIDHLRRFIHYAKAALGTTSAKSLWDDGCFNLSLGYYLKGMLPEAIQIISMQTGDMEKLLLQQVKFFSLGSDMDKQYAMQIVTKILNKNPYAIMLLLQDKDVLMNPNLPNHLNSLCNEAYLKAEDSFMQFKGLGIYVKDIENHFSNLQRRKSYLSSVESQEYFKRMRRIWGSLKMKKIEGGTFSMGATEEQGRDILRIELPIHDVTVNTFYLSESPVTQALWVAIMESNPSSFKGEEMPVDQVSWNDCQEFIRKLNKKTGNNFRLPTEAEWEYAARGGNKSKGYRYSGSDDIELVAWCDETTNHKGCRKVKTKRPNELGLYDMSGNICEWCADWYGDYSSEAQVNPKGPEKASSDRLYYGRVLRGGNWFTSANMCRVSYRMWDVPFETHKSYGFRLAFSQ